MTLKIKAMRTVSTKHRDIRPRSEKPGLKFGAPVLVPTSRRPPCGIVRRKSGRIGNDESSVLAPISTDHSDRGGGECRAGSGDGAGAGTEARSSEARSSED